MNLQNMFEVPLLGRVVKDQFEEFRSEPISVKVLGGQLAEFVLVEYEEDGAKEDFHQAIEHFLSLDEAVLTNAQEYIFMYYKDIFQYLEPEDDWYVVIEKPEDVWQHIRFGTPYVSRRFGGDEQIYISMSCFCQWEQEHGLQIVFKQGKFVNKVGPVDGHLTNSDSYGDEELEGVVYRG